MRARKRYSFAGAAAIKRRSEFKQKFWGADYPWKGPDEVGYFCGPRSLPLILQALALKEVSGDKDPGRVYVELLSCHAGQGVIEMSHPEDHAYSAGYTGTRAWRDRMKLLEQAGFIKSVSGGRAFTSVFLVHPAIAMQGLRTAGKIPDKLWTAYQALLIDTKEPSADDIIKKAAAEAEAEKAAASSAK